MFTRVSLVVTVAPMTGIAPEASEPTTVPIMNPRAVRVPGMMVVSCSAAAANIESAPSVATLTANRGTFVIGARVILNMLMVADEPAPVPVLTHRRPVVRASSRMPTNPSEIPEMLTLSKLHAQPVAPQLPAVVSSAPPASGGAVGFAITIAGSTTATLIMLKLVTALGSSAFASGCGAAVPETVTSAGPAASPPASLAIEPPAPESVLLLLLLHAPTASAPESPTAQINRIMVK